MSILALLHQLALKMKIDFKPLQYKKSKHLNKLYLKGQSYFNKMH